MQTKLLLPKITTRSSKGQSLVEFELALVIIIFLLLAVTDFGLAFFSWISLRDAAQEGATYASVAPPFDNDSIAAIRSRVKSASTTPVNLNTLADDSIGVELVRDTNAEPHTPTAKSFTTADTKACPGYAVRITVTYQYRMISPMISVFVGSPTIPISANVTNTILLAGNGVDCE